MIKLFLTDIDGCLTDGGYYVASHPVGKSSWPPSLLDYDETIMKRYYTRDFHGLQMLHENGIEVGVISNACSSCDYLRIKRASPFVHLYQGVQDKLEIVTQFVKNLNISLSEISYIGDDVLDIGALNQVGYPACPNDAIRSVKDAILLKNGTILKANGGYGCIREYCDWFLGMEA